MAKRRERKGVSLAKGPVALLGMASIALGVLGFVLGGNEFDADVPSGVINGETFLGIETNGWTNLLFIAAGSLLMLGAQGHWGAKSASLIVGLALGAASVIAIVDGEDVFGIFAANGLTKLIWGAGGTALIVLALLPRVGKRRAKPAPAAAPAEDADRRVGRGEPVTTGSRPAEEREPRR